MIQLDDEQYLLYAAFDPDTNDLLHTTPESTRAKGLKCGFFAELRKKHDIDDAVFFVDGAAPFHDACNRHGLDSRYERHGNGNSIEVYLER